MLPATKSLKRNFLGNIMLSSQVAAAAVSFEDFGSHVLVSNGIVDVTFSKPGGLVTSINYGGITNLLEVANNETNRGYWDLSWSFPNGEDHFDVVIGTRFYVISNDGDKVELSFYRPYVSSAEMVPLNIDKRFVLLRGSSGFYSYAIYQRPPGWSDFNLNNARLTFKLRQDKFDYMAIGDTKQRVMPYPQDRLPKNSQQLAYPEAVILTNPRNPDLKGEVDDKYQYSTENRSNRLHGWISFTPLVGFWMITASYEFKNGGPLKQNLQSHVGPTCLSVFHSTHYAGLPLEAVFRNGEAWKKVFGPVFIYLNSASTNINPRYLWNDAKQQLQAEIEAWPYSWPASPDFALAGERGSVSGTLLVQDSFVSANPYPASFAFVGLALPGEPGSWQEESKGYQFWSQADGYGNFNIPNVIAGTYDLYGWVPGVVGNYKKQGSSITVSKGSSFELGTLVYQPPRDGPTVWEIGVPERTAAGFYVPDPDPKYVNKLFLHQESFRQYGLWQRYSELYPDEDLVFTIGSSDWAKDWFFIHGCRVKSDGTIQPCTWEIRFGLEQVSEGGVYTLRLAIASSAYGAIQVRVNESSTIFDTHVYGRDNAIARHGLHGLYSLWSVEIKSALLKPGENSLFLKQRNAQGVFAGVMYDYIRLEAPDHGSNSNRNPTFLSHPAFAFSTATTEKSSSSPQAI